VGPRRQREKGGDGAGPWAETAGRAPGGRLPLLPAAAGTTRINFSYSFVHTRKRLGSILLGHLYTRVTLKGRLKGVCGLGLV
jgi:hypothetical protein